MSHGDSNSIFARSISEFDLVAWNQENLGVPGNTDLLTVPLLVPVNAAFRAPNRVALYLFKDGSWVVENFNDLPVQVELNGQTLSIEGRGWNYHWERQGELDRPAF